MGTIYKKINRKPVELYAGADEEGRFQWMFWWGGKEYSLDSFIRTHHNPWCSGKFPDYIHGYEADSYWQPLCIEIVDDEHVNLYTEIYEGPDGT